MSPVVIPFDKNPKLWSYHITALFVGMPVAVPILRTASTWPVASPNPNAFALEVPNLKRVIVASRDFASPRLQLATFPSRGLGFSGFRK